MSLTDNRTHLTDCEVAAEVSGDTTAAPTGLSGVVGTIIEGSDSIEFQVDDAQEAVWFDLDLGGSTFNIDLSDSTIYVLTKFGTPDTYLGDGTDQLGGVICLKDAADGAGGDGIGYAVTGADVAGFPYEFGFKVQKLDVSVVVSSPGTNGTNYYQYFGTEAGLNHAAILQVGWGSFSLVKAVSSTPNAWFDGIYYIANDSYAVSIIGGSSGTPETMADVVGDDITVGMGLFNNPKGSEYGFFGPTEWGASTGDTYFQAADEQWYWIGDNAGGHVVGGGHFDFRILGGSGTNSFVISNIVIVSTGTRAGFLLSNTGMETLEVDGCTFIGLLFIGLPTVGGTSRFMTNCTFNDCRVITHHGADISGGIFLNYSNTANTSYLVFNESTDPDGFMDNLTFTMGSTNTHAIEFGTSIPATITLRGLDFSGYSSSDNNDASVFHFQDTSGTITVNLIDCTHDGSGFSVRDEGATIDLVIAPVATKVTIETATGTLIENARVFLETADDGGGGGFPFEAAVTSLTQSAGTATLTATAVHGLATNDYVVIRGAGEQPYNSTVQITVTSTTVFTFAIDSGATSPAGGTPVFSYMPVSGLTDVNGEITSSKSWPASQALKGWARKSTSSPYFVQTAINITDASSGTDLLVALQSDE